MRDYAEEFENRVRFIREILSKSGAEGIVFGNSGGRILLWWEFSVKLRVITRWASFCLAAQ